MFGCVLRERSLTWPRRLRCRVCRVCRVCVVCVSCVSCVCVVCVCVCVCVCSRVPPFPQAATAATSEPTSGVSATCARRPRCPPACWCDPRAPRQMCPPLCPDACVRSCADAPPAISSHLASDVSSTGPKDERLRSSTTPSALTGTTPHVLLINCGLHDIKCADTAANSAGTPQIPLERYRCNVYEALTIARKGLHATHVVWVRTTPVVDAVHNHSDSAFHRHSARLAQYNDAADKICAELQVCPANHQPAAPAPCVRVSPPPPPPLCADDELVRVRARASCAARCR